MELTQWPQHEEGRVLLRAGSFQPQGSGLKDHFNRKVKQNDKLCCNDSKRTRGGKGSGESQNISFFSCAWENSVVITNDKESGEGLRVYHGIMFAKLG